MGDHPINMRYMEIISTGTFAQKKDGEATGDFAYDFFLSMFIIPFSFDHLIC